MIVEPADENMKLTKTNFIQYLNCPKSVWLMLNDPETYPKEEELSDFDQKLIKEGYEFEGYVKQLIASYENAAEYDFQKTYETDSGLYARVDIIRRHANGTVDLYEIKSSTSVKNDKKHHHLYDAAFQTSVAKRSGETIGNIFIVHLNKEYIRQGEIDPAQMVVVSDETDRVNALLEETDNKIDEALTLISQPEIDQTSCTCLYLGKGHHCNSFNHFNPNIPMPSIYTLPSMWGNRLKNLVDDHRFGLDEINLDELTKQQKPVLEAFKSGGEYINIADIDNFFGILKFPLYFLDYEAYGSAIPMLDGLRPHEHLPFQFSLHIMEKDGSIKHVEYLADELELPEKLVEGLANHIGPDGSIIAWHKTYENERNKHMAELYPDHTEFLLDLVDRTMDLEDVFKTGYVNIEFKGSTSIKKVLPVLVPELSYDGMEIAEGTAAMDAWAKMVAETDPAIKMQIRNDLLKYCELDTLAMVKIYEFIRDRFLSV